MQMSAEEIVREYRTAKNKPQQRKILAELNSCSLEKVDAILMAAAVLPTRTRLDQEAARKLYDAGHSDAEIAQALGAPKSTIANWRSRANLPLAQRSRNKRGERSLENIIDTPVKVIKEAIGDALVGNAPMQGEYDPLIYDAFDLAIAKTYERGRQPSMVWRRLLRASESHIERLGGYVSVSEAACMCAVELAALAAVEEVFDATEGL